jgi:ribosomal subunit interface protein
MDLTVLTKLGPDGKETQVDELVHKHLQGKLGKLEQRAGKALVARAVLVEESDGFEATITLHGGIELVGKAQGDGLLKAVDAAVDKLTRQFESDAEKREGRERGRRASGRVKAAGVA